jgi:hypothetical protein
MILKIRYFAAFAILVGLFVLVLTQQPKQAKAWGKFGHLVVCDLAYRNLTDASQEKLKELFNGKKGITVKGKGKMPDRHYTSFNLGCLEEDELPRQHADDHFINVSRNTKSIDNKACPNNASCIFDGIERDLATLKNVSAPKEDRVAALMAIGHWFGDIHQPLHISFADDRGGNWIDVKLTGKCGRSSYRVENLHGMWDNCLLEAGLFERVRNRADFKKTWSKNTITYRGVDTLLAQTSLTQEKAFVVGEPWEWAQESYAITLTPNVRYCVMIGGTCQYSPTVVTLPNKKSKHLLPLDQNYLAAFERIAEERVKKAGFRLAHELNRALDPAYTGPIQNSTQKP